MMCLSIPGKILSIDSDGLAVVDYGAEKRSAKVLTPDFKVDDFVIVSNKIVVTKVPEDQAQEYIKAIVGYSK